MKKLSVLLSALLVLALLSACSGEAADVTPAPSPTPTVSAQPAPVKVALTVGDIEVSENVYRYFFFGSIYNFMNTYGSMMTEDFSFTLDKPLDEQIFYDGITWQDFFQDQTTSMIQNTIMLSQEGRKAGLTIDEDWKQNIEDYINSSYQQEGVEIDELLHQLYGGSFREADLREALEHEVFSGMFGEQKLDEFQPTQEQVELYYQANKDDFDVVTYREYAFTPEMSEDGTTVTDNTHALAEAQAFVAAVSNESDYAAYVTDVLQADAAETLHNNFSGPSDERRAWLYGSREPGDVTMIDAEDQIYVLLFVQRAPNTSLSIRHILLEDVDGVVGSARTAAEDLYKTWQKGDATEESFAALAMEHSTDPGSAANGGLYNDVTQGQMVETFDAWCFDPIRQVGDTGLVDTTYGTHIMYYVGTGQDWAAISEAIASEKYSDYTAQLIEQYPLNIIDVQVALDPA